MYGLNLSFAKRLNDEEVKYSSKCRPMLQNKSILKKQKKNDPFKQILIPASTESGAIDAIYITANLQEASL